MKQDEILIPKTGLQVIDAPAWRLDRTWHQCVEQPLFVDGEAALHSCEVAAPATSIVVRLRGFAQAAGRGQHSVLCTDTSCSPWTWLRWHATSMIKQTMPTWHARKQARITQQPWVLLSVQPSVPGSTNCTRGAKVSVLPQHIVLLPSSLTADVQTTRRPWRRRCDR